MLNLNGSGHESAPVLLPGFAIIWQQNQVTRRVHLCDFTQILFLIHYLKLSIECSMRNNNWRNKIEIWSWYVIFNWIFSYSASSSTKQGFICLSVCPSMCVPQLFCHVPIIWFSWNLHKTSGWKVYGHMVCSKSALSLCAYLTNPLHILHKYNSRNNDVSHTISRSKDWRWRSQRLLEFCHACSMALCLYDRSVSYVAQIQPRGSQCVTHHFPSISHL